MKFFRFLLLIVLLAGLLFAGPALVNYTAARDAIPPGVTMAGASVGGATPQEAAANLRQVFESPVLVTHGDRRLVLTAAEVGFAVDAEAMVAEARRFSRGFYYFRDFLLYLFDQPPLGGDVPLRYTYDRAKLATWLHAQAQVNDNAPTPARANLETLQFTPGQPGRTTDLNTSAPHVLQALTSAYNRQADLALVETPPLPPDYTSLEAALRARLADFPGIYSVYFQHLDSGHEIDIDADTAFAGMSTVKIPILLDIYYLYDLPLETRLSNWISDTVKSETASNAAANALLYYLGNRDAAVGARVVTEFARQLGLQNTFIALPYDSQLTPPAVRTPANTNPEFNTFPDPAMQTTPRDMGMILADIGRCAEGRGNLLAAYPDRLTPAECAELIDWMTQNPMGFLIRYGVPEEARVAHKHGYGTDTQGDVALIYGPEGPYVLSIYVYQYGWVVWEYSNPLMNDLSRLVWNFYLVRQGQPQLPPFTPEERAGTG